MEGEARSAVLEEAIEIIEYARARGETDLRQIREWVKCLKKQSAHEFLAEMPPAD